MRSRLLSAGTAFERVGFAAGGTSAAGAIQYLKSNPGAGFLPCNGARYSETLYPGLAKNLPLLPGALEISAVTLTSTQIAVAQARAGTYKGRIVSLASSGTSVSYTDDPTGQSGWVSATYPVNGRLNGLCWGPQGFFGLASGSTTIYRSADGQAWASVFDAVAALTAVIYNEILGLYVAVGNSSVVVTSTDGVNWTQRTTSGSSNFQALGVINAAGDMMAIGSGAYISSIAGSGGLSWYAPTTISGASSFASIVPFGGNVWAINGNTGALLRAPPQPSSTFPFVEYRQANQIWGDGSSRTSQTYLAAVDGYLFAVPSLASGDVFYNYDADLAPGAWVRVKNAAGRGLTCIGAGVRQAIVGGTNGAILKVPTRTTPIIAPAYADDGTTLLTPYLKAA